MKPCSLVTMGNHTFFAGMSRKIGKELGPEGSLVTVKEKLESIEYEIVAERLHVVFYWRARNREYLEHAWASGIWSVYEQVVELEAADGDCRIEYAADVDTSGRGHPFGWSEV